MVSKTDAEMIIWLRALRSETDFPATWLDLLDKIADRLEQLTIPDPKSPVTETRLKEIREQVGIFTEQERRDYGELLVTTEMMVHLIVAHDYQYKRAGVAESMVQILITDEHSNCVAAGVAQALEVLYRLRDEEDRLLAKSPLRRRHHVQSIVECIAAVRVACGPGSLPPHLVTLEENRRMRLALEQIIPLACDDCPGNYMDVREIATKALGGHHEQHN